MVGGGIMRNPLYKRLGRDLRSNLGRYLAITVIFILLVSIISGYLAVAEGMQDTFETNRQECLVEDGQFSSYFEIDADVLNEAEKPGVQIVSSSYYNFDVLESATLRVYANRETFNLATAISGRLPDGGGEIAIDRLFAEQNDLEVGETIRVNGAAFEIVGLVSLPDYSALFQKNTDMMMDSIYFGVAVVSSETFADFPENQMVYSCVYRYRDRDLSKTEKYDLSEAVKKSLVENGVQLTGFIMAENNQAVSYVSDDLGSDMPMMMTFNYIIVAIMAFVFSIIINSTIEQESAVIGTLLASGYRKGELIRYYLSLPILMALAGCLIGYVLSLTVTPPLFSRAYYSAYSLPPLELGFSLKAVLNTIVLPIILLVVINAFVLVRKLGISPLNFLRRDLRRQKNKAGSRLPNFGFLTRFRLRVILQSKGSYLILFFGMLFASFLLMFGLGILPTINHYMDVVGDSAIAEYQYILKLPVEAEAVTAEKFTVYTMETTHPRADADYEVSFYGVTENSAYFTDLALPTGQNEIVISDALSGKLGVGTGDELIFTAPYTGDTYTLTVTGVYPFPSAFAAFMPIEKLNLTLELDADYFNGYLSSDKLDIDDQYLATTVTREDYTKVGEQLMSTFGEFSPTFMLVSIAIYLVLMYVLTKTVIDKNAMHISFMKVLGYRKREIRGIYLRATTITVLASLLITLPLAYYAVALLFLIAFLNLNSYLTIYIPWYVFGEILAIGAASYFIINAFHVRHIDRIDMAEALKDRE